MFPVRCVVLFLKYIPTSSRDEELSLAEDTVPVTE